MVGIREVRITDDPFSFSYPLYLIVTVDDREVTRVEDFVPLFTERLHAEREGIGFFGSETQIVEIADLEDLLRWRDDIRSKQWRMRGFMIDPPLLDLRPGGVGKHLVNCFLFSELD